MNTYFIERNRKNFYLKRDNLKKFISLEKEKIQKVFKKKHFFDEFDYYNKKILEKKKIIQVYNVFN